MSEYISSDNDESSYDNRGGWSIPSTRSYSSHAAAHAITSRNSSYGHSSDPIIVSDSEDDIKKEDVMPLSNGEYLIVFSHTKVRIKFYWPEFKFHSPAPSPAQEFIPKAKEKPNGQLNQAAAGSVRLTKKVHVDSLTTINTVPRTWAVPRLNDATLLDISHVKEFPCRTSGEMYTIDGWIRAEVHLFT